MSKIQENSLRDNLYKVLYYIVFRNSDNKFLGEDGKWWSDYYEAKAFESELDASSQIDDIIKGIAHRVFGDINNLPDEEFDKYLEWEEIQQDFYDILEVSSSDYDID